MHALGQSVQYFALFYSWRIHSLFPSNHNKKSEDGNSFPFFFVNSMVWGKPEWLEKSQYYVQNES